MNEMLAPFVSVIIPVRNDEERLKICLSALMIQTYHKDHFEIIVIDNNSKKDLKKTLSSFRNVRLEYEPNNGSYAARNKGIDVARGEILAFTDSDCIPDQNWIENGVNALSNASGNIAYVSGMIEIFFKNSLKPTIIELGTSLRMFDQKSNKEQKKYGVTANIFVHKKIFDIVGYFNSTLLSGGDYEWGQRVARAGYDLLYADNVRVKHPALYTFKQVYRRTLRLVWGHYNTNRLVWYSLSYFIKLGMSVIKRIAVKKKINEHIDTAYKIAGVGIVFILVGLIWDFGYILIKLRFYSYLKKFS